MNRLFLRLVRGGVLLLLLGVPELRAEVAKAAEEYAAGNFREAAALYHSAIESGPQNAAVFYNLGNALYRAGETGPAILNYERALALQPNHPEARANLRLAQEKARALELPARWWDSVVGRATPNQLLLTATVAFWAGAFFLAAWMTSARRPTLLFLGALVALGLAAGAGTALVAVETGPSGRNLAIVVADKVEARVATADNAGSVLALPPGSEITIVSTRGDWIYAALPNDLRGWIPAGSAERVRR